MNLSEELLTRLVDALESINSSLADISVSLDNLDKNIDSCIASGGNARNRFLCVTGNVTNY